MTKSIDMTVAIAKLASVTPVLSQVQKFASELWGPEVPGLVLMADLATELSVHVCEIDIEELKAIFEVVEELMSFGTQDVGEAAATGFLEQILNEASSGTLDFDRVRQLIGPKSTEYCVAWNRLTLGPDDTRFDP